MVALLAPPALYLKVIGLCSGGLLMGKHLFLRAAAMRAE